MSQKYLLDTNVILRLILRDSQKQYEDILELFNHAEVGKIELVCPSISLFETSFVLLGKYYNTPKEEFIPILETLLSLKIINFEEEETFRLALEIFSKNSISLVDSYLIAKSNLQNFTFFSFDQKALKTYESYKNK